MQLAEKTSAEGEARIQMPRAVVVIGASTGGPTALAQILPKFPRDFQAAIVVVQHMRRGFTKLLAEQLNGLSELAVNEAEQRQAVRTGTAFFTPGDYGVKFERSHAATEEPFVLRLEDVSESMEKTRKRVDAAMTTAAEQFGTHTIGVLLTGVGDDGREGIKAIREHGGKTIVQDESSSVVFDMPRNAIDSGCVDEIIPLWNIADRIIEIVGES